MSPRFHGYLKHNSLSKLERKHAYLGKKITKEYAKNKKYIYSKLLLVSTGWDGRREWERV